MVAVRCDSALFVTVSRLIGGCGLHDLSGANRGREERMDATCAGRMGAWAKNERSFPLSLPGRTPMPSQVLA